MKIYQIHQYGGAYEDAYDYIVGSYLSQDKAIVEKERFEKEEKIKRKCNSCPLYICDDECNGDCGNSIDCIKHSVKNAKKYCDSYASSSSDNSGCKNYCGNGEESDFRIDEVEVIE